MYDIFLCFIFWQLQRHGDTDGYAEFIHIIAKDCFTYSNFKLARIHVILNLDR